METYRLEMNKEEFLGMLSNYFTSKLGKQIKVKGVTIQAKAKENQLRRQLI